MRNNWQRRQKTFQRGRKQGKYADMEDKGERTSRRRWLAVGNCA